MKPYNKPPGRSFLNDHIQYNAIIFYNKKWKMSSKIENSQKWRHFAPTQSFPSTGHYLSLPSYNTYLVYFLLLPPLLKELGL